jgi:Protein of unknown function (DUF1059)
VDKVLHCDCGFDARAEHEDELAAVIQRHAWEAHGMPLSCEEALLLAFRAQMGRIAPLTISCETALRTDEEEK